jgi:large subunit ribosomal protein L1
MVKAGKKLRTALEQVEDRTYILEEAAPLIKKLSFANFDETVELAIRLGVDSRKADQMVRGVVVLPHGTGKIKKVAVIASGEKINEAEKAGADVAGGEELVEKISQGWFDFDVLIVTPDMMKSVGRLGKLLGPKKLMPSPKTGTVTFEVTGAISEVKRGRVEFRVDKGGNIQAPVGRVSFDDGKLVDNCRALVEAVIKAKPAGAKGRYIRGITVSTTMGPGVKIDPGSIEKR